MNQIQKIYRNVFRYYLFNRVFFTTRINKIFDKIRFYLDDEAEERPDGHPAAGSSRQLAAGPSGGMTAGPSGSMTAGASGLAQPQLGEPGINTFFFQKILSTAMIIKKLNI